MAGTAATPAMKMAGGEGFEPSFLEPESSVLPLDDPPAALNDDTKTEGIPQARRSEGPLEPFAYHRFAASQLGVPDARDGERLRRWGDRAREALYLIRREHLPLTKDE